MWHLLGEIGRNLILSGALPVIGSNLFRRQIAKGFSKTNSIYFYFIIIICPTNPSATTNTNILFYFDLFSHVELDLC